MEIDVKDAALSTATVALQTITVSGKQMTLAVFRQLIRQRLVDTTDGHLYGIPWGTVNYHPAKECEYVRKEHLHVVWQLGALLRRACVEVPNEPSVGANIPLPEEDAVAWLAIVAASGWRPAQYREQLRWKFDEGIAELDLSDKRYLNPNYDLLQALRSVLPHPSDYDPADFREQYAKSLTTIATYANGQRKEDLAAHINDQIRSIREQRRQIWSTWDRLCALPQLFIAV